MILLNLKRRGRRPKGCFHFSIFLKKRNTKHKNRGSLVSGDTECLYFETARFRFKPEVAVIASADFRGVVNLTGHGCSHRPADSQQQPQTLFVLSAALASVHQRTHGTDNTPSFSFCRRATTETVQVSFLARLLVSMLARAGQVAEPQGDKQVAVVGCSFKCRSPDCG